MRSSLIAKYRGGRWRGREPMCRPNTNTHLTVYQKQVSITLLGEIFSLTENQSVCAF